ncbi:MAG TPA: hypothetical protein VN851_21595 [Thermoanaerobaculia bacterium]|nr:hypothetical protein [Thermoanaerobaculia bacterium]
MNTQKREVTLTLVVPLTSRGRYDVSVELSASPDYGPIRPTNGGQVDTAPPDGLTAAN